MTILLKDLSAYLDQRLNLPNFAGDISNNGLQVEIANLAVKKVALAVDASLATMQKATETGADLLLVHHGLSWGGEPRRWNGFTGRRFEWLFGHKLALYAVHLPLDAHPELGNNRALADLLNLSDLETFFKYDGNEIGFIGALPAPMTAQEVSVSLQRQRAHLTDIRCYGQSERQVQRVGVISGGAGMGGLLAALECGCDLLVTGEFDHTMYSIVAENPITVLALGHYDSEVFGVQRVGEMLQEELSLECCFVDVPTGL